MGTRHSKCNGFDHICGDLALFTVEGTEDRDEWHACEPCAREALLYTYAVVTNADGVQQRACPGTLECNHLVCPERPRYQIAMLDHLGRGRFYWDVIPRTYSTYAEAFEVMCSHAGDRDRWVVQPVWEAA